MSDDAPLFNGSFLIRLALGGAVGGLLGWGLSWFFGASLWVIALPALLLGLLSAFFGDDFWSALGTFLGELIGWWGWW